MRTTELREVLAVAMLAGSGCAKAAESPPPPPPPPPPPLPLPLPLPASQPAEQPVRPPQIAAKLGGALFETSNACGDWTEPLRKELDADRVELRASTHLSPEGREPATLVITRHGVETKVTSEKVALQMFAPIDSPAKVAALLSVTQSGDADCSTPWIRKTQHGYDVHVTKMVSDCPITTADLVLAISHDGSTTELARTESKSGSCAGRRPSGLVAGAAAWIDDAVGRYFAAVARLESASIVAFDVLAHELAAHGAPGRLVRAARRARRDEVVHARVMSRLAARFGGCTEAVRVIAPPAVRSLRDIAIENAREGCVRETWGALEATWQAQTAEAPEVRAAMACIARDETRHAALAWQVAEWAEPQLAPAARAEVRIVRAAAADELAHELTAPREAELIAAAGVPSVAAAATLLQSLRGQLSAR